MSSILELAIKENQITVFVFPTKEYTHRLEKIVTAVSNTCNKICYTSMNKPYNVLFKTFKAKGIDTNKFVFIDCISGKSGQDKNVFYVSSPKALTELSISITKALKTSVDCLVFDSLSTLLIYEKPATAIKFAHAVISRARNLDKKCILTALAEDMETDLMQDLNMVVDKVIELGVN